MTKRRLPATTIVETIMSLLLVFIAFGIGIGVYMNVLSNDRLVLETKAMGILQKLALEAKSQDRMLDESLMEMDFRIEKKVSRYTLLPNTSDLYLLELQAFDVKDRLICTQESLLYYPNH